MKAKKLLSLLGISMLMLTGCTGGGGGKEDPPTPPTPVCEHTYRFVSDGEAGHHEKCSKCGDEKSILPHRFDEGTPGTGVILYECLDCGYQKTETVEVFAAAGVYNFDNLPAGDITERTKLAEGIYFNASSSYKFTVDAHAKPYTPEGGTEVTSVQRLKSNGASQGGGDRTIEIDMEKAGRIIAYAMTSSSSDLKRHVALWNDKALVTTEGALDAYQISPDYLVGNAVEAKEFHVVEKGKYFIGAATNSNNFYAIQIIYDTCAHEFTKADGDAATCAARGTTVYTCSKCSTIITVADKARLAHTWDEEHWVHADGFHWHECTVCHTVMPDTKVACTPDPEKHKDAEEPTESNPITYQEDTCTICGGTWEHDPEEYVAPDQKEFVIADGSKWTDTTARTEHVLSDNCKFIFAVATKLATGGDAAGVTAFKLDPAKDAGGNKVVPNQTAWDDRYFLITGVSEGDVIKVKANVGGSNRGIKFGLTADDQIVVPKVTEADKVGFIEHTVTAAEATSGVRFSAYTTDSLFIEQIVWVKK